MVCNSSSVFLIHAFRVCASCCSMYVQYLFIALSHIIAKGPIAAFCCSSLLPIGIPPSFAAVLPVVAMRMVFTIVRALSNFVSLPCRQMYPPSTFSSVIRAPDSAITRHIVILSNCRTAASPIGPICAWYCSGLRPSFHSGVSFVFLVGACSLSLCCCFRVFGLGGPSTPDPLLLLSPCIFPVI